MICLEAFYAIHEGAILPGYGYRCTYFELVETVREKWQGGTDYVLISSPYQSCASEPVLRLLLTLTVTRENTLGSEGT
jgi:hypothetical protein